MKRWFLTGFFSSTYKHCQRAAISSISYFILLKIKDKKFKLMKAGNRTTANYWGLCTVNYKAKLSHRLKNCFSPFISNLCQFPSQLKEEHYKHSNQLWELDDRFDNIAHSCTATHFYIRQESLVIKENFKHICNACHSTISHRISMYLMRSRLKQWQSTLFSCFIESPMKMWRFFPHS